MSNEPKAKNKTDDDEKKKDGKNADYFIQGVAAPILNGASECLKSNTRCMPRSWDPKTTCKSDASNDTDCAGCANFDTKFQRCPLLDSDPPGGNVNNTWVPNPSYVQSCFKGKTSGNKFAKSIILTNGLAEQSPFYREYDPCWFADDPTDVRCMCKIMELGHGDAPADGMCGGPNYVFDVNGTKKIQTGEGCYMIGQTVVGDKDTCIGSGTLKFNRLSPQSPWRQNEDGTLKPTGDDIQRSEVCKWIPKDTFNTLDNSTNTIPIALAPDHFCKKDASSKYTTDFRVRGVSSDSTKASTGCQGHPSIKTKTACESLPNKGTWIEAGEQDDGILCGLQGVCLLNGSIVHNNGKCCIRGTACTGTGTGTDCQYDSDCNPNLNEVCVGDPKTLACGADSDCESGADFWGNIIPAYGEARDLLNDKGPPMKCRKSNEYPWRQYLRASKCTYIPSTQDEDDKSVAAAGAGFLKDAGDAIGMIYGVPLGSMFFGDPDKDAKEQLQRAKDTYSKITPMQSMQFAKVQAKLDAEMIQFAQESTDLLKATESAAQQQIEFLVKENTLFISILSALLILSILFELI